MPLEPGQTIQQYRVTEQLGEGGMGVVWKATDTNLDRDVAIKVLPAELAERPERLERFEQEARTTGSLNHPNVVTIYDLGRHEDAPYIVMELVPGETLREKIACTTVSGGASTPSASVPPRKALEYVTQIARGLAAAHERGVVHRDLKPENIIITPSGQAKILDFGLAKLMLEGTGADSVTRTSAGGVTAPGSVMGTVGYMAPEQVRGKEVDHRADIFALGTILYELLAGKRAFQAESPVETMNAIITVEPPSLSGEHAEVSPVLDRIIRRCLEKEPGERFRSGHDLAFALQAIGEGTSTELKKIETVEPRPSRRWLWAIGGMAVTAVLGFFAGGGGTPRGGGAGSAIGSVQLTQLTFEGGVEAQPAVSPDGRSLVYRSGGTDRPGLHHRRVGGETAIFLTAGRMPMFSPDGERVAYSKGGRPGGVFLMGATGESVRRLTDFGFNPSWSPDGESIVVATEAVIHPFSRGAISQLWRFEVATGEGALLSNEKEDAVQPRYSPRGYRIAYWGLPVGTGHRVLYTMPADGGEAVALTDDDATNWNPVWSPDGNWLYFLSDRAGIMNVWRLPIDERTGTPRGPAQPVTTSAAPVTWLDVAGETGRLVFSTTSQLSNLERVAFDPVNKRFTGAPETLLQSSMDVGALTVSPNGRWAAFGGRAAQEDVYVLDLETRDLRRLTDDIHKDRVSSWSPDSERIFFYSSRSGSYQIWSLRPDGSGLTQLTDVGEIINRPMISPDGRRLVVVFSTGSALIDLEGAEFPVTAPDVLPPIDNGLRLKGASWSPDGRRLVGDSAYEREPGGRGKWIYEIDSGEYRQIDERGGLSGWFDDRTLEFPSLGGIATLDIETGERKDLLPQEGVAIPRLQNWTFSSDHSWLYFEKTEIQGDVWMLDHE